MGSVTEALTVGLAGRQAGSAAVLNAFVGLHIQPAAKESHSFA
jgi:hypothetical protein